MGRNGGKLTAWDGEKLSVWEFFSFFNAISLRQSPQPQANVLWRETTIERATAAKEDWVWWCMLLLLRGCNCGEWRVKSREMLYVKVERWQRRERWIRWECIKNACIETRLSSAISIYSNESRRWLSWTWLASSWAGDGDCREHWNIWNRSLLLMSSIYWGTLRDFTWWIFDKIT